MDSCEIRQQPISIIRRLGLALLLLLIPVIISCGSSTPSGPAPYGLPVESNPAWSHSGTELAFGGFYNSKGEYSLDVYFTDSSGSYREASGTGGLCARWLPGDTLLVISTQSGFVLYHKLTGASDDLNIDARNPLFDVSHDGNYVYYAGRTVDSVWSTTIFRRSLIDGVDTAIVAGWVPRLDSTGVMLAFQREHVYFMNLTTGQTDSITSIDAQLPAWGPDGNLFLETTNGIYRYSITADSLTRIGPGWGTFDVSPNGIWLLYVGAVLDARQFQYLWKSKIDGSDAKPLF